MDAMLHNRHTMHFTSWWHMLDSLKLLIHGQPMLSSLTLPRFEVFRGDFIAAHTGYLHTDGKKRGNAAAFANPPAPDCSSHGFKPVADVPREQYSVLRMCVSAIRHL